LVYSIYDSTEVVIEEMVKECQRKIAEQHGDNNNSIVNEHLKLKIRTLQNAPRDLEKLRRLLEIKQRQKEGGDHIEDTQRG
jgi:hypothetical protein